MILYIIPIRHWWIVQSRILDLVILRVRVQYIIKKKKRKREMVVAEEYIRIHT